MLGPSKKPYTPHWALRVECIIRTTPTSSSTRDSPFGTVQTNPGITFPIEDGKFSPTAEVLTSLGSKAGQPMQRRTFDLQKISWAFLLPSTPWKTMGLLYLWKSILTCQCLSSCSPNWIIACGWYYRGRIRSLAGWKGSFPFSYRIWREDEEGTGKVAVGGDDDGRVITWFYYQWNNHKVKAKFGMRMLAPSSRVGFLPTRSKLAGSIITITRPYYNAVLTSAGAVETGFIWHQNASIR